MARTMLSAILLLAAGCVFASDADQKLADAIKDGDVAAIRAAAHQGANINADVSGNNTRAPPLIYAILLNRPEVVDVLLELGADPNDPHHWGYPLYAAVNADTNILKLLLRTKNSDLNAHNESGAVTETALERAVGCRPRMYAELVQSGGYLGTPPDCAGDIRLLIEAGADPNFSTQHSSPLFGAIYWNNVDVVRALLDGGAKLDVRVDGITPLMHALQGFRDEMYQRKRHLPVTLGPALPMVEYLLQRGTDPNGANDGTYEGDENPSRLSEEHGYTPLTVAAREGWTPVVELLLRYGASSQVPRQDGATAIYLAKFYGHTTIVQLISEQRSGRKK